MHKNIIIVAMISVLLSAVLLGSAQQHKVEAHVSAHHSISVHSARARRAVSVCFLTGLSGPALQENNFFCQNGQQIDHSVYVDTICLAQVEHIVVGVPGPATFNVDWAGNQVVDVEFNRGFHAEHHTLSIAYNTVRIYYNNPHSVTLWTGTTGQPSECGL